MTVSSTNFASSYIIKQDLPEDIRPEYEALENKEEEELPGEALLKQAQDVTSDMLEGKIPQDVQDQIEQMSAERSLQGGFGFQGSQRARNLTARDLGLKSTDLMNEGVKNTAALSQSEQGYASVREDVKRTNNQFYASIKESDLKQDQLDLAAFNLISENQRVALSEGNKLILANSQKAIKNLQENLDVILGLGEEEGFFFADNDAILDIVYNTENY